MSIQRFDIEWLGDEFGMHKDYRESGDYTDAEVTELLYEALQEMIDWANSRPGTFPGGYPGDRAAKALAAARGES